MRDSDFQLCISEHFYDSGLQLSYPCFYMDSVSSTQDALKQLIAQGTSNKTTVFTFNQTHGRGRNNSSWETLSGKHLFFSHFQNLKLDPKHVSKISLLIGMSLRNTLQEHYHINAQIKWPNDLYIEDKKLSGILCESVQSNSRQSCIIGIGININSKQTIYNEISPAFAQNYSSKIIHRWELLGKVLSDINACLSNIELYFNKLLSSYSEYDYLLNKTITVESGQHTYKGLAKGINPDGALRLEIEPDKIVTIHSGHINF